mmetsp:Transcript_45446/g.83142  ORF Transcript_45446/g.83142 Transcript_45446/m.83142 type:complete len:233 (+) Transcript_45446:78-776(+)
MSNNQDFYAVLEVARDASDADIKKAYRKAALRWHPDKNPDDKENAERMFKLVAEAYDVLSDPRKRSLYDQGGKDAVERGSHTPGGSFHHAGVNPFDLFEQFFGGKDPFAMFDEMRGAPGRGPFDDPFFNGGFGGFPAGGAATSFSSFSSSTGAGGGMMTSTSTVTKIVNGKRVSETTRTVRGPDGRVETTTSTSEGDGGNAGGMLGFGGDPFAGNFFGNPSGGRGGFGRLGF